MASLSPLDAAEAPSYRWFWFLYEQEKRTGVDTFAFRPFYTSFKKKRVAFDASLMPLVFWRYRTNKKSQWFSLFGLVNSLDYRHENGIKDYDFGFFPLVFFGMSPDKKDRYFMLWPFGGRIRGKLGQEVITPILFPGLLLFIFFPPSGIFTWQTTGYLLASLVPVYVSWSRKNYKAWGILWPLIRRGIGPGRDDLRILPFYAHSYKEGWYRKYNILLLFNYSVSYFSNDTRKMFFFFPVFGRKWSRSGRISSYTILWPFFSWGYDKKLGVKEYNLPWPLVQIGDSRKPFVKKRIFFPFYGYYRYGKNETFFVTPLYFSLKKKGARYDSAYYTNFLIVWWYKRDYHFGNEKHGNYWRYFKIWPLFSIEYNEKGDYHFNMLSLFPFRDKEGYEFMYEPLWTLFEYRRYKNGEKRLGLLFRTFYQRWGEHFYQMKIPLVVSVKRQHGMLTDLSFLLYMFGYSHNKEGKYLKLFWIPIRIGDPESSIASLQDMTFSNDNDDRDYYLLYLNGGYLQKKTVTHFMFEYRLM